jgi:hypothetical protein
MQRPGHSVGVTTRDEAAAKLCSRTAVRYWNGPFGPACWRRADRLICAKPIPAQIRPSAMPYLRCAAHRRLSALSGFLPVRPGSRAGRGPAIPGLDGQAAGLAALHAVAGGMTPISFSGWQARGQRRLRPHPPAGHGLPGQPQEGSAQPGAAARARDLVVSGRPVGEGAGDGGGPAGDLQQPVDVFQVGAHGSSEMPRRRAIWELVCPAASRCSSSQCRAVSLGAGWRRRSASR